MAKIRQAPSYSREEFEREAHRIDALTFETLGLEAHESVVFCGFTNDGAYVKRALEIGCKVAVIEARDNVIRANAGLGVRIVRGSTSVIPARENAFDVAVAAGYLHEVDPSFHAQIISELARVARRVGIIEIAPPSDPLGRRIAALYSRAKREFGSFEHYQTLEYWKKLLAIVKADVSQVVFQFAKLPPIEYLVDTVDLLLDTIEAEEAPEEDIAELRRIAKRSDEMLLPQARMVLVGASAGELQPPKYSEASSGQTESVLTVISGAAAAVVAHPSVSSAGTPAPKAAPALPATPPPPAPAPPPFTAPPPPAAAAPPTPAPTPAPPPIQTPTPPPAPFAPTAAPPPPIENPFGLPDTQPAVAPAPAPFGLPGVQPAGAGQPPFAPFPVPPPADSAPFGAPAAPEVSGQGWSWEPPEDDTLG